MEGTLDLGTDHKKKTVASFPFPLDLECSDSVVIDLLSSAV